MQQPLAETLAGGDLWSQGSSLLNSGLTAWMKVEQIKAVKSSSGQDQQQQLLTVPLANGAAIQVENAVPSNKDNDEKNIDVFGMRMNKGLAIFSGAVLVGALILKVVK